LATTAAMALSPSMLRAQPASDQTAMMQPTSPMALAYDAVSERNLFIKGMQRENPQAAPENNIANSGGPMPLVLDGVSMTDSDMVAYIEDTGTGALNQLKVGDSIGQYGRIIRITLHELDLQQGDKTVVIAAGQTLSGQGAFDALYMPQRTTPTANDSVPTTAPTGDDILSRLARRRILLEQQMNGGGAASDAAAPTSAR